MKTGDLIQTLKVICQEFISMIQIGLLSSQLTTAENFEISILTVPDGLGLSFE
jgi:hypothetical protein